MREFLASTDERFRPVYLSNAPDGTLYVVDMYRGIIQDRASTTVYLRDHISRAQAGSADRAWTDLSSRARHHTARQTAPFADATPAQLVEALSHPNGWRRDTAQRLLVERGAKSVIPALVKLAEAATDYRTRLHALWTLDGIDSLQSATVTKALADPSRDVRASAIRLAERWLGDANHPIQAEVLKRLDDSDWSVREQLAASLGALPPNPRETAVASLLERYANDPIVVDAGLSGLRGSEAAVLQKLLVSTAQTPQRDAAITMLAATIVRSGQDAAIQTLFVWLGDDSRPGWQRSAVASRSRGCGAGRRDARGATGRRGGSASAGAGRFRVRRVRVVVQVPGARTHFRDRPRQAAGAAALGLCG